MRRPILEESLVAAAVAASLAVASLAGLPQALGAHPWWAQQSGIVGGVGGAVLWFVPRRLSLSFSALVVVAGSALLASAAAAHFGKQVFAASFAQNALAGRFWSFGWFAISGSVALLIATVVARVLRRWGPCQPPVIESACDMRLHDLEIRRQVEVARREQ